MLNIKDLKVKIGDQKVLKGIDLKVKEGEIHVLMGPNGSGKSTLSQSLMGNPDYKAKGDLTLNKKDLLDMNVENRFLNGLFLSFQHPVEIPGVSVSNFLRMAYNKKFGKDLSPIKFRKLLAEKMVLLDLGEEFAERYLNDGFSGGEKKKMEVLQMLMLKPTIAVIDEIDSGLDVDSLKAVANAIKLLQKESNMGILLITHYTRILKYIVPDYVHIMKDGKIVESGG